MKNEKQLEITQRMISFIDNINATNADAVCGMIKPGFVSFDGKSLVMSYPVQSWERNPIGRMQGGVIATMLDFTAGCLSAGLSSDKPVTVSMQVSYLRPGPLDGEMRVKATVTKAGRTLIHSFVECWDAREPEKTVATANCVYMA